MCGGEEGREVLSSIINKRVVEVIVENFVTT